MRPSLLAFPLLAAVAAGPLAAQSPAGASSAGYDQPPPDAAPGGPGGYGRRGGGRPLTRDEAMASVDRGFAVLDANRDGVVTRAEVDAYREARRAEMRARRDGEGGDPPPGGPPPGGFGRGGVGPLLNNPAWFDLADTNRDGRVTLAEARAGAMALFARMDLNGDGTVDPDERRQAMMRGRGPDRAGPDGAPPPPPPPPPY